MTSKTYRSKDYDWKQNKPRGWQYDGDVNDPQYIKDRQKLFAEAGNGWWRLTNTPNLAIHLENIRKEQENE